MSECEVRCVWYSRKCSAMAHARNPEASSAAVVTAACRVVRNACESLTTAPLVSKGEYFVRFLFRYAAPSRRTPSCCLVPNSQNRSEANILLLGVQFYKSHEEFASSQARCVETMTAMLRTLPVRHPEWLSYCYRVPWRIPFSSIISRR